MLCSHMDAFLMDECIHSDFNFQSHIETCLSQFKYGKSKCLETT